jgi:hypothetical protein
MKEEIFQDNKARWALFEQIDSLPNKLLWAVIGAVVALVGAYLLI